MIWLLACLFKKKKKRKAKKLFWVDNTVTSLKIQKVFGEVSPTLDSIHMLSVARGHQCYQFLAYLPRGHACVNE